MNGEECWTSTKCIITSIFDEATLHNRRADFEEIRRLLINEQYRTTNNNMESLVINNIVHRKLSNGSYKNTILIRSINDTFVAGNCNVILINTLSSFWETYYSNANNVNILIDSRLVIYIMYATICYGDDVLIYNVYSNTVKTIYEYVSESFHIPQNQLSISMIKLLLIHYALITVFLKSYSLEWNTTAIIDQIDNYYRKYYIEHDMHISQLDIMLHYIKIKASSNANVTNVKKLIRYFMHIFSNCMFTSECNNIIAAEWDIADTTIYECYIALTLLKNMQYRFIQL